MLATMWDVKQAIRQPSTFPGCYPLSIIMSDGEKICPTCAEKNFKQIAHDTVKGWKGTGWDALAVTVLWEGDHDCANCGCQLEAYPSDERLAVAKDI